MKKDLLQKAHLLYELEGDYLERLLERDETYSRLLAKLAAQERRLAHRDQEAAETMASARRLLMEMTREACFKMGYLLAHDYPLEQAHKLED